MKKLILIFAIIALFILSACSSKIDPNSLKIERSSDDIVGDNYQTIITELEDLGFSNIETKILDDLIFGWLKKDGEIEQIEINGENEFSSDSVFPKDSKIIITYHTFPIKEPEKEASFPKEIALRTATVAFTNYYATDVFTPDGNHLDTKKFHSFADTSGFYLILEYEGTWTIKNETTWHVDHLVLKTVEFNSIIDVNLDVNLVDNNYVISNLSGKAPSYDDISVLEEDDFNDIYFIVPPELVKDDRAK